MHRLHYLCEKAHDLMSGDRTRIILPQIMSGSVVLLIIVLLESKAFRRNTSCLFTFVVLCIVSTIAPIIATNKIRLGWETKRNVPDF